MTTEEQLPSVRRGRFNYHPSDIVGCPVVDAITGSKYPWIVGKEDENRFFKVIDAANNVRFDSVDYGRKISHKLYYETPYHYMSHRNVDLPEEFIKEWYEKQNKRYPGEFVYSRRNAREV